MREFTVLIYPSSAFNKPLAYKSNALIPAIPLCRATLSPFPSWTSMPGRRATTDTTPHTTQSTMPPHTTPHTTQHPHHTTTRPHTRMPQSPRPQPHPIMWSPPLHTFTLSHRLPQHHTPTHLRYGFFKRIPKLKKTLLIQTY